MSLAFPMQIGVGLLTFAGSIALVGHVLSDWTPGFRTTLDTFAHATLPTAASVVKTGGH